MAPQQLLISPDFMKMAAAMSKDGRLALIKALSLLANDVRHPGLQTKKIKGAKNVVYECRVNQSIRLVYDARDGILRCWYVGPHDDALQFGQESHDLQPVDDIVVENAEQWQSALFEYLHHGSDGNNFAVAT